MKADKSAGGVPVWFCGTAQEWEGSGLKKALKPISFKAAGAVMGAAAAAAGAGLSMAFAAAGQAAAWGAGPAVSGLAFGVLGAGLLGPFWGLAVDHVREWRATRALLRIAQKSGGEERLIALEKSANIAYDKWDGSDSVAVKQMARMIRAAGKAAKMLPEEDRPNMLRERHKNAMEALEAMRERCPEAFAMKEQVEMVESIESVPQPGLPAKARGPRGL